MDNKWVRGVMAGLLLVAAFFLSREGAVLTGSGGAESTAGESGRTIVIDAGHGGEDPGMVGIDGLLEKEINLQIAGKLAELLEQEGFCVVMTRTEDVGLYEAGEPNHKVQDMQNRCRIIARAKPVCTVSIHQNSYQDEAVKGPQVFYFTHSEKAKGLAHEIQTSLNEALAVERARVEKDNASYYLLKRSEGTTVIVECGFITNRGEAKLLAGDGYQDRVARAIAEGVMRYCADAEEQS